MSTVWFISDVHLGGGPAPVEAAKERDLIAFLAEPAPGDDLYALGDLFDFWFDYGAPPPVRYEPVLRALKLTVDRGVRIRFMGGNHDYWARSGRGPGYLERAVGIELIGDPHPARHQGRRLLLTHGDALGGVRGGYRAVRAVLRHPWAIGAFRRLPARWGYAIAARTSALSRGRHDAPARERYAGTLREAALEALGDGYDAVVAGHVHVPERIDAPAGVYLNLGDWIAHRTYGRLAAGELALASYAGR